MVQHSVYALAVLLATLRAASAKDPLSLYQSEWDTFNITVGGRLGRGVPFARGCFENVGPGVGSTAPGADCATVQAHYANNAFRAQTYGAREVTQWEICQKTDERCLLDANNPTNASAYSPPAACYQGSVSPYYVDVRDSEQVTHAFAFSKKTGVPLSIKNTGHDFLGRSTAPGTLSLWTQNIKYINYSTSFLPEGCDANYKGVPALTYGAGQDMDSLFLFAEQHNITFIGGSWRTVGAAGGWAQGGGHSILTNTYGLGADRVVQFKVVTPDGQYRTANACQNRDLFWALRGGGGGTFGVVLEATSEVVPNPVPTIGFSWTLTPTAENLKAFLTILVENAIRWSEEAEESLKPITDFFKTVRDGAGGAVGSGAQGQWAEYSTFLPLFTAIVDGSGIPNPKNRAIASRLIPRSLFHSANSSALVDAALEVITRSDGAASFYFATPFSYDVKKTQQGDSSVTPAWRSAVWHALVDIEWPWNGDADQARATYEKAGYAMEPLRELTPGGGAYQNEADVYEPDVNQSFWGSNYAELLDIKNKYDPDRLLDCWHCVGWKGKETSISACYI
ncbi:hypothetical protein OPQ81_000671 [Rhizoctonia solani]|nr:hypothetical protein OPQ81_000671 [Rhizoctonia solani]